jgi:competence protein ComGC
MRHNKGVTIIELVVVVCIFLLMVAILTPFVNMTKMRWYRIGCANNLRELSLGLHSYAADHNDTFPEKLGDLYPNYVTSEKVFDCPAIKNIGTKEAPDYEYTSGLSEIAPPKEIIVRDQDSNHRKTGNNILRVDGSVEWAGRRH